MGFFLSGICFVRAGVVWMRWAVVCVRTLGGWQGRVGRSLDVFVDAVAARKEVFRLREAAGGQSCAF